MIATAQDILDLGTYASTNDDAVKTMAMAKLLGRHSGRSTSECLGLPWKRFLREALDVMNQLQLEAGLSQQIDVPDAFINAFKCIRACCS